MTGIKGKQSLEGGEEGNAGGEGGAGQSARASEPAVNRCTDKSRTKDLQ